MNTEPLYRYRHLAHIVIEAKTPLVFGSGEKDILTDNMIAKDANGLPYIPGSNNEAVREIFGTEGKSGEGKVRGKALFSDIFKIGESEEKILNHVAIDSFTGGAVDGALFSEKVLCNVPKFTTEVLLCEDVSQEAREAFEAAVKDLCSGMLPLGGGANRGHGIFFGSAERTDKNGERISIYKTD